MTTTYDMPLPGATFDGRTVIASCYVADASKYIGDENWLLLLLNEQAPFYSVEEHDPNGLLADYGTEHNINYAVAKFADNGGDA